MTNNSKNALISYAVHKDSMVMAEKHFFPLSQKQNRLKLTISDLLSDVTSHYCDTYFHLNIVMERLSLMLHTDENFTWELYSESLLEDQIF